MHRLAGFRAAHSQDVAPRRGPPKIVVKSDHAVDLCMGKVEGFRNRIYCGFIDVSKLILQSVQDRQESAGQVLKLTDTGRRAVLIPTLPFGVHSWSPVAN
jgi:hypothetical protein